MDEDEGGSVGAGEKAGSWEPPGAWWIGRAGCYGGSLMTSSAHVDQLAINTIRFLAVDMVESARSGHPGAPMGQAPMAYLLWTRYLRHSPAHPDWPNRDRFVLSCGHASALLYGLLHLAGYDLPLDEIKRFRQLGSKTPGHPEYRLTPGVETTTGPLGQGLGNAVGMAIAERMLSARFNRPGFPVFQHRVWVLASDEPSAWGTSTSSTTTTASPSTAAPRSASRRTWGGATAPTGGTWPR